ncbi:uncharacterized protein [Mytilus edulis]|uniref:uncharacterized protein n=1 Tax=Mytilus edulis TaxID=6550 RepID=UPI0039EEA51A
MDVVYILLGFLLFNSITADYPFSNTSLSWRERVDDLVSRLTMEEIMYQMARGGAGIHGGPAPAVTRLGIGPYQWNTECLRGDVQAGNATAFPEAIGLAATFSPDLIFRVAEATAKEVRAKHNNDVRHGYYYDHTGLSCFSPVINIMRNPLWGRNQETYGEDPHLSGLYATSFVKGLQGDHPRYIRANAGCKHFDVHGGPEDIPSSRFGFNAVVSERDWRLTFLPAFKKCVDAGSYSLMCSYNSINGVPACANSKLLTSILRDEWNFTGYVVSDEVAIENIMFWHQYYLDPIDTVAGCVNAGCNLELSGNSYKPVYLYMLDAIKQKKLTENTVREKVKPLFNTRMRLGEFDPPSTNPYMQLNLSVIQSKEHRELALEAATKSIVMLKGGQTMLPIFKQIPKIAVVGPMANNTGQLFGDYSPDADPRFVSTPWESLRKVAVDSSYAAGCQDGNKCTKYSSSDIQNAVKDSYIVFVCLGTGTDIESEGTDRRDMELPGKQLQLLQDAVKYGGDVSVVLLLFSAGPVNITWAEENKNVVNIFQCFYPAQATGEALLTLFTTVNNSVNPSGRLPYTWYKYANQIPSMIDYSMKEKTYRYFSGEPLYPFGFGLTYTTYNYSNLVVPATVKVGEPVPVQVTVTNTGLFDGDEVVQVYIHWLTTKEPMPNLQLVAVDRVFIQKHTKVTVKLIIDAQSMAVWTDKGFVIEPGSIQVYVGGQLPNQKKTVPSNVLSATFKIVEAKL